MNHATELLQQRLVTAYTEQSRCYDAAAQILEQAQPPARPGPCAERWSAELQTILEDVSVLDSSIAADKIAWRQTGATPGEPLRAILEKLAKQIRFIAAAVDLQVATLTAQRQQMLPEMDGLIRQRRMLQAYDHFSKPMANS